MDLFRVTWFCTLTVTWPLAPLWYPWVRPSVMLTTWPSPVPWYSAATRVGKQKYTQIYKISLIIVLFSSSGVILHQDAIQTQLSLSHHRKTFTGHVIELWPGLVHHQAVFDIIFAALILVFSSIGKKCMYIFGSDLSSTSDNLCLSVCPYTVMVYFNLRAL